MTKGTMPGEISILRFFETGPIEKAEVVFNIVREKMRERMSGRGDDADKSAGQAAPPKQSVRQNSAAAQEVTGPKD